ncbi:glycoside hydrolase family 64 protein [Xylariaceae sp. FL0255]|nr:glycoside hydrolase family 64 protein [Xylariaceae sp. FL0255]
MRGLFNLAAASVVAFVTRSVAVPIVVKPGSVNDVVITSLNTINGTGTVPAPAGTNANSLQVEIVNNYGNDQMYLYIDGKDSNNVPCLLGSDGTYYYPDAGGSTTPVQIDTSSIATPLGAQGSSTTVTLPDTLQSARIWVSQGELTFYTVDDGSGGSAVVEPSVTNPSDPSANVPWGFVEFNWSNGSMFANISYVDWVGIVMGMSLTLSDGSVQTVKGLQAGAIDSICNDLKTQGASDGQAWGSMCVNDASGNVLRVLSSNLYTSVNPDAFSDYYTDYINQVWSQYTSEPLMVNTQMNGGNSTIACQVSGDTMTCAGDETGYQMPTITDIWGCNSGPFANIAGASATHQAVVARLCAAFDRSTLLLNGGNVQPSLPSSSYYTTSPTNHYARIVHNYEADGVGYAFAYDDVNPAGQNAAGTVSDNGIGSTLLRVTAGGWSDA